MKQTQYQVDTTATGSRIWDCNFTMEGASCLSPTSSTATQFK